ncbi:MAG: hypothetical protein GY913_21455 [Proteobacteria bacterium]|nr:hypothetical protein [Actinomycetes bacterium]MCP4919476.1 hypothetical protein [Pseudomonadota bacterium]
MSVDTKNIDLKPLLGLDERWEPMPGAAEVLEDMTWTEQKSWAEAGGFRSIAYSTFVEEQGQPAENPFAADGAAITSLHWFSQHNGAKQWLIWETGSGALRAFNGSNGHTTTTEPWDDLVDVDGNAWDGSTLSRAFIRSPSARTQSQAWGSYLYLVNGHDQPIVFNGHWTEPAGFDSAPAPPDCATIDTGTGLSTLGLGSYAEDTEKRCAYSYKLTVLNERGGESPASEASSLCVFLNDASTRHFNAVSIGEQGASCVAVRVWRTRDQMDADGNLDTVGKGRTYYFVRELQYNGATTFVDGLPDTHLGNTLDEEALGPWPRGVRFIATFKDTMFLAGHNGSEVVYSRPNRPEIYPLDNRINVGDGDGGEITGIYTARNAVIVTKTRGIYFIKGDPKNGFYAQTLTQDLGSRSINSVRELPGLGVVLLSNDGIHLIEGTLESTDRPTRTVNIGQPISKILKKLNLSALENARSAVYHRDKEYWLAVPTLGSTDPNLVLVFHYEVGQWSVRKNFPIACMAETRDHRGYLFFGSHDATNSPGIHLYSRAHKTKQGTSASSAPKFETAAVAFPDVYRHMQLRYVHVHCVGYGDNDIQLNLRTNRSLTQIYTTAKGADMQYKATSEQLAIYGEATWNSTSASVWAKLRPITVPFDVGHAHKGWTREVQVELTPEDLRLELIAVELEFQGAGEKPHRPSRATAKRSGRT